MQTPFRLPIQWVAKTMSRARNEKLAIFSPLLQNIHTSGKKPADVTEIVIDTFNDWLEIEDPMGTLTLNDLHSSSRQMVLKFKNLLKQFIDDLRMLGKMDDFWAFQIANILSAEYLPRKKSFWSKLYHIFFN